MNNAYNNMALQIGNTMKKAYFDMLKEEIVRKFKPKPLTGVAEQRLNIFENTLKTYTEFPLYGSPLPFKALIH